ncbi:MAG: TerB family tellurite resistance protein [Pseudomonadota bacterium]
MSESGDQPANREARAASGAFLMVILADCDLAPQEKDVFLSHVADQSVFQSFDRAVLKQEYQAVLAAMTSDYGAAAARILDDIKWVQDSKRSTEAIKVGVQMAIVADKEISPQEEAAISKIEEALGLERGIL